MLLRRSRRSSAASSSSRTPTGRAARRILPSRPTMTANRRRGGRRIASSACQERGRARDWTPACAGARGVLPFHLAIPALRPLVALLVDGVPVDVHQLRRALADRRDLELLVVDLRLPVHRPV